MDALDTPIVCNLNPAELELNRDALLPGITARAQDSEVLPEGIRWRFTPSPGLLSALAAMIDAERRCCPFLQFTVVAEIGSDSVSLEVTGPTGTRQFLDRLPRRQRSLRA